MDNISIQEAIDGGHIVDGECVNLLCFNSQIIQKFFLMGHEKFNLRTYNGVNIFFSLLPFREFKYCVSGGYMYHITRYGGGE